MCKNDECAPLLRSHLASLLSPLSANSHARGWCMPRGTVLHGARHNTGQEAWQSFPIVSVIVVVVFELVLVIIYAALLLFALLITWRVDKANTIELAWRALKITHTPRPRGAHLDTVPNWITLA